MSKSLNSKLVGVTFSNTNGEDRQEIIKNFVKPKQKLLFEFDKNNEYFKYSVAAYIETENGKKQIGYLSNDFAVNYYNRLDQIEGSVAEVTGIKDEDKNLGVNIKLLVPDEKYPWNLLIKVNLLKGAMNKYGDDLNEYSEIEFGFDDEYSEKLAVYAFFNEDIFKRTKIGSVDTESTNKLYWYENNNFSISPSVESVSYGFDGTPEKLSLIVTIETKEQYKLRTDKIREKFEIQSQISTKPIHPSNMPIEPIGSAIPKPTAKKPLPKVDFKKLIPKHDDVDISPKNRTITLVLCVLLGYFGGHQFYAGRKTMGIVYIFTLGLFTIGWIIDFILIILGQYKDKEGRLITTW